MNDPQILRIRATEEQIRAMARGDRDLILQVTGDGDVSARCKKCVSALKIAGKGQLLWFHCPKCDRVSMCPLGNVQRDMQFAIKDGRPFVSELAYFKKLPPFLQCPFERGESDTRSHE